MLTVGLRLADAAGDDLFVVEHLATGGVLFCPAAGSGAPAGWRQGWHRDR